MLAPERPARIAMKYLVTLLVGIGSGALLALFAVNLLARQQPAGKALMVLMQQHVGALRAAIRDGGCASPEPAARFARLAALGEEIAWAFPAQMAEAPGFVTRRDELLRVLAGLHTEPSTDCAGLAAGLKHLTDHCDACHNAYRH